MSFYRVDGTAHDDADLWESDRHANPATIESIDVDGDVIHIIEYFSGLEHGGGKNTIYKSVVSSENPSNVSHVNYHGQVRRNKNKGSSASERGRIRAAINSRNPI